jgi:NCS2 family nucleobase:cation symporter-2
MAERPRELIYARDERPPALVLLALGFQHVAVICPYLVMVALVAAAAKLPHADARNAMGLAMIAVAFHTVLQSRRLGPVGSGMLCPPVVSAIYLPSAMAAASAFGFPVVCGMVVFAGTCEVLVGRILSTFRKFFPPVVSGVVIVAVGLELGKIGLGVVFAPVISHEPDATAKALTAASVLATMTGLAVWAKGTFKLLCVLIGILLGYALAAGLGLFPEGFAARLSSSPLYALPDPSFVSYGFEPSLIVPFAIAGLASGLRAVGVLTTCQKLDDAQWRRPEMRSISGGVVADGLGCAVGGALGAPGMSASPSLVGLERTTGATSRVIAWSIAGWLLALSLLPKFMTFIVEMPRPVMGAALFFNGALMLVAGIQIIVSRPVTLRATVIVGFSVLAAFSVLAYPELYAALPHWTRQVTGSEITMAVVVSVALNALFRLGTWDYSQLRLGTDGTPLTAAAFDRVFAARAREWKIQDDDARRIRAVVDQAIEAVVPHAQGPVQLRLGSDSFDVTIQLSYTGNLPSLPDSAIGNDPVEEQAFVAGLTGYLSGLHADRMARNARDDQCEIALVFRL